jgi:hypothetical protein
MNMVGRVARTGLAYQPDHAIPPGETLRSTLGEQLACLPVDVYKVEATAQMIALYWGEREAPDSLQKIASFLLARA